MQEEEGPGGDGVDELMPLLRRQNRVEAVIMIVASWLAAFVGIGLLAGALHASVRLAAAGIGAVWIVSAIVLGRRAFRDPRAHPIARGLRDHPETIIELVLVYRSGFFGGYVPMLSLSTTRLSWRRLHLPSGREKAMMAGLQAGLARRRSPHGTHSRGGQSGT
jgi:hypothetical protein